MKALVGEKWEHTFSFSQADVQAFATITGDDNPVHLDEDYTAMTAFKKPIMHGFLSGSVFSKVFGTLFPGKGSIYMAQSMVFKRPMYVDTEYTATFDITATEPAKGLLNIKGTITDGNGKVCLEGEARLMNKNVFANSN